MVNTVIVLSGGRSRRFGGVHKPGVLLGERSVISRIISTVRLAVPDAGIWVAGPADGLTAAEQAAVSTVREEPVFSGPLAGIDAGVRAVREQAEAEQQENRNVDEGDSDVTLVLAGDMPLVSVDHLRALVVRCKETGQAVAGADDRGKLQFLCAAWPTDLLRSRLSDIGETRNKAVKLLFLGLEVVPVAVDPGTIVDFDTPEEFERISAEVSSAAGGRPVPTEVLRIRDHAEGAMTDGEVVAILEFASRIKHSQSSLSPVLAAFLAGRMHAEGSAGVSMPVEESLQRVEEILTRRRD